MNEGYRANTQSTPLIDLSEPDIQTRPENQNHVPPHQNAKYTESQPLYGELPASSIPDPEKDVCFGMLSLKIWAYTSNFVEDGLGSLEKTVDLVPDTERPQMILIQINRQKKIGSVDPLFSQYIVRVLTTPRVQYQAFIPPFGKTSQSNVPLRIVIYGPYKYGPTIGTILRSGGLELMMPTKVREGKQVHNPHLQLRAGNYSGLPANTPNARLPSARPLAMPSLGPGPHGPLAYGTAALPRFSGMDLASQQQVVLQQEQLGMQQTQNQLQAIFANIVSAADLPEWEPPSQIKSTLYPHQKQALYWMIQREKFVNLDDKQFYTSSVTEDKNATSSGTKINRLWKKNLQHKVYVNVLTGHAVHEKPEITRGGIVADDMGLGKTIQVLSLIVSTALPKSTETRSSAYDKLLEKVYGKDDSKEPELPDNKAHVCKGTLIICPLSTVSNWEDQIASHVDDPSLTVFIFHGPYRRIHPSELAKYDIVITTYNVVAIEFKMNSNGPSFTKDWRKRSILHEIFWRRIVLDEAHIIRNPKTLMSQACVALEAERRWCLTGTPLQNRLMDIFSLLCFLRVSPFNNSSIFKQFLDAPLAQRSEVGVARLQTMMKAMTLRRVKSQRLKNGQRILELPPRSNQVRWLTLSTAERGAYDAAFNKAQDVFKKLCDQNVALKNYTVLLTLVLRLRQLVTYPGLAADYEKVIIDLLTLEDSGPLTLERAQKQYAMLIDSEETMCSSCNVDVLLITARIRQSTSQEIDETAACMSPCGHLYCLECVDRFRQPSKCFLCDSDLSRSQFYSVTFNPELLVKEESTSSSSIELARKRVKSESSSDSLSNARREVAKRSVRERNGDESDLEFLPSSSSASEASSDDEFMLVTIKNKRSKRSSSSVGNLDSSCLKSNAKSKRGKFEPDFEKIPPSTKITALLLDLRLVHYYNLEYWLQHNPEFSKQCKLVNLDDDGLLFEHLSKHGAAAEAANAPDKQFLKTENSLVDSAVDSRLTGKVVCSDPSFASADVVEVKDTKRDVVYLDESESGSENGIIVLKSEDETAAVLKSENKTPEAIETEVDPLEESMSRWDFGMRPTADSPTKSVIFSQWTSMLDTLEPLLKRYNMMFERLDGRMSRAARTIALQEFKNNPICTIMLVSLQAGGVGLNLTSASRIYILEPYWNPAVEQQAVDRVYRLGQRKPVVMIRYVVKASIEESILQIQQHKLELAALALREHVSEMAVDLETEADNALAVTTGKRKGRAKRRNWSDLINHKDLAAIREEERKRNRAERMFDLRTLFNIPKNS